MSSSILLYRSTGTTFTAPFISGSQVGATTLVGNWENDWAQIVPFAFNGSPFLLFYRKTDGAAFTAPILSGGQVGATTHIGNWEKDWVQILSFNINGNTFLLFYRATDGATFTAPILSGAQVGATTHIGNWENDWAQIVPFAFNGSPFLLFYRKTDGAAFTAPILSSGQVGATTHIGNWEKDWVQILSFNINGNTFLLFYRATDGAAFTAPILSGAQVGATTHIGNWENDWAQILPIDTSFPSPNTNTLRRDVTFNDNTPLGGWIQLTLDHTGAFTFSGHIHDSGFDPISFTIVAAIVTSSGLTYGFAFSGKTGGTFSGGSRDSDWLCTPTNTFKDSNGNVIANPNPSIAANWDQLAQLTQESLSWKIAAQDLTAQGVEDFAVQTLEQLAQQAASQGAQALLAFILA